MMIKTSILKIILVGFLVVCSNRLLAQQKNAGYNEIIDIGSERELFLNDFLVQKLSGQAELRLHHPVPREVVLKADAPWEGSGSGYFSVFKDGDLYRMYYRGMEVKRFNKSKSAEHPYYFCYAESNDGIHWRKPDVGIYEFEGSKKNNIVLASGNFDGVALKLGDNAAMFKDENMNASPDARYKAFAFSSAPKGLFAFKSSDGIHWSLMSKEPVITDGAFDSQNIGFYDVVNKEYRAYWRIFVNGVRSIRTATSDDFIHWKNHLDLKFTDTAHIQLYTNQIKPYYRAPRLLIGFPTRYIDRGWSESMRELPELKYREQRSSVSAREGTAITEGIIMSSLDGVTFERWKETFLRPGLERTGTWNYGQQYIAWNMAETRSSLEGAPNEISIYATEDYKSDQPIGTRLRRYTIRADGFVSVNAPLNGGSLVTRPVTFQGSKLTLNFSSSAAGSIQVEIQDLNGQPLNGFSLEDCPAIFGDTLERTVHWKNGDDVSSLAGKPVKLLFVLKDADLYSFQFQK
jgi:hypothetical protein